MLATAALAPAALGLVACGEESVGPQAGGGGQGGTTNQQGTSAPQQPREVTLGELNNNPGRFVGQQVTVSGEVQRVVVAPGAFTVGTTGDEDAAVVVLPTRQANIPSNRLSEGDTVRVQGTVQRISARISQDDDFLFEDGEGFNEEPELFQEFQNRVAIAASRVDARIPEDEGAVDGGEGESSSQSNSVTQSGSGNQAASITQRSGPGRSSSSSISSEGGVKTFTGTGATTLSFMVDEPSRLVWTSAAGGSFSLRGAGVSIDSTARRGQVSLAPGRYKDVRVRGSNWKIVVRPR